MRGRKLFMTRKMRRPNFAISILRKGMSFFDPLINNTMLEDFSALLLKLLWRVAPSICNFTCTVSVNQYKVAFRPFIASDVRIISTDFEPDVRSAFSPKPNETVIDVGAHLGLYTLAAATMVGQNGKVISIEPDEANLTILKKNVAINKLNNTTVLPIALGDFNGWKKFYAGVMPSASSFYPTHKRLMYKIRKIKKIETVTLDTLLERLRIKDVDWIKVDVEGADLAVIRGGELFLHNSKNVKIIIEVSSSETLECLKKKGFQVKQLRSCYFAFKKRD